MPSDDNEPVIFGYSSSKNVRFHGSVESGYTKGEWRKMSQEERDDVVQEWLNELIDVDVEDGE